MKTKRYWMSPLGNTDDFGVLYDNEMIDGRTKFGPWANMTPESFRKNGVGQFGTGYGQRYVKQTDGKWLKVEG